VQDIEAPTLDEEEGEDGEQSSEAYKIEEYDTHITSSGGLSHVSAMGLTRLVWLSGGQAVISTPRLHKPTAHR